MKFVPHILVLLTLIFITLLRDRIPDGLEYRKNMLEEAAKVATGLFAVALFLERSTAVINGLLFGDKIQAAETELAYGKIAVDKAAIASGGGRLLELDAQKERVRLVVSFIFASFLAAAGTRTLAGLLELPADPSAFFQAVDVVLTAGLLAGGSNALGILADTLKKQVALALHRLRNAR